MIKKQLEDREHSYTELQTIQVKLNMNIFNTLSGKIVKKQHDRIVPIHSKIHLQYWSLHYDEVLITRGIIFTKVTKI